MNGGVPWWLWAVTWGVQVAALVLMGLSSRTMSRVNRRLEWSRQENDALNVAREADGETNTRART